MSKVATDKMELLNEPLHGIFIPTALMIVGISILNYTYLPYVLLFLAIILTYRAVNAYRRRNSLHPEKWRDLELVDQTVISKNSAIYRFKLLRGSEVLDIPVGHHVAVKFDDDVRYYTPISSKYESGYFDIIVKSYPDGNISKKFAGLRSGQSVKFRGPVGRFNYATNHVKELGLVAGGSGITPILQVISEITTTPEDLTNVTLIYANETENDILLKDEIDNLAKKYPNFSVHYVLQNPPNGWTGSTGRVTKELIDEILPKASDDARILICGPPGMNKDVISFTEDLGFSKAKLPSRGDDQVFVF